RDFHVTGVQTCALPILAAAVDAAAQDVLGAVERSAATLTLLLPGLQARLFTAGVGPLPDVAAHVVKALDPAFALGERADRHDLVDPLIDAVAVELLVVVAIRVEQQPAGRARAVPLVGRLVDVLELGRPAADHPAQALAGPLAVGLGIAPVDARHRVAGRADELQLPLVGFEPPDVRLPGAGGREHLRLERDRREPGVVGDRHLGRVDEEPQGVDHRRVRAFAAAGRSAGAGAQLRLGIAVAVAVTVAVTVTVAVAITTITITITITLALALAVAFAAAAVVIGPVVAELRSGIAIAVADLVAGTVVVTRASPGRKVVHTARLFGFALAREREHSQAEDHHLERLRTKHV